MNLSTKSEQTQKMKVAFATEIFMQLHYFSLGGLWLSRVTHIFLYSLDKGNSNNGDKLLSKLWIVVLEL
jgi:hypothetical protein